MKKLTKFNLILSAFALIMIFSSFVALLHHPTDRTKFLKYGGSGNHIAAINALTAAYEEIKLGNNDTKIGDVYVFQCPDGLWFCSIIEACDYPEICGDCYVD